MSTLRRIIYFTLVFSMFFSFTLDSNVEANGSNTDYQDPMAAAYKIRNYEYEGKIYKAIPMDSKQSVETVQQSIESTVKDIESIKLNDARLEDRQAIKEYLESEYGDIFGGTYSEKDGTNVYLLTKKVDNLEKRIKEKSKYPDKTKFKYVKYSKKELKNSKKVIYDSANALGLSGVGMNSKTNKVNIYLSEESFSLHKDDILKKINEDMVNWIVGDMSTEELAYDLYPGERINMGPNEILFSWCSLGFNAFNSSGAYVGVTAGHCGNSVYFDLSDGSSSIGSMNNAVNSPTSRIDAGYINYVSSVDPSVNLNLNSLTIGTFDYNGSRHEVGDAVTLHAQSFGGNGTHALTVLDESFDDPNGNLDMVLTENAAAVAGDSGGLFYSHISNGKKTYACIEGILKGRVNNNSTGTKYLVFSKFKNVYDGLKLGGVLVDSSY
ncbi:hypothetical protein [Paenibacillus sp. 1001270B_150601_E10]|uniref:hypothetical protein n=1 Tax=Paenibacillus sp. 1001270B_150601_E10 TaxID=2787079 RepID=UPI00189CE018|nr:hypothetical protein [Paenibacillus sp. 1001270B_150601_E10]